MNFSSYTGTGEPPTVGQCATCKLPLRMAWTETTAYPGKLFCGSRCIEAAHPSNWKPLSVGAMQHSGRGGR